MEPNRRHPESSFSAPGSTRFRCFFGGLIALFLIASLTACSLKTRTQALFGQKVKFEISIAEDANNNNPVAVDYVLVYNKELMDTLLKMPAREWFEKRGQFKRDYPGNEAFASWSWEWIPGQEVEIKKLPVKTEAKGSLVFANYFSKGDHRARIGPNKSFKITLLKDSFVVAPK